MARQRAEQAGLHEEFPDPAAAPNVMYDPGLDELREFAGPDETTTEFGSPAYVSEQKSRSADHTRNLVDHEFDEADWDAIAAALDAAGERDLVCLDRRVGRNPETAFVCRLFVPRRFARIALAWGKLLEPAPEGAEPDFQTLQLPNWDERRIRVLPEAGLTFVLGSDYTGEAKKSFLRLYMYRAKQLGGLGIHAGTKRLFIDHETDDGGDHGSNGKGDDGLTTVGQAFLGLSATGKSTLTGHRCWLDNPEGAEMLQDDVCALLPDGTVAGSEGAGLYIKTIGLDREEQPALYDAATDESAVFENVGVAPDGSVDFEDGSLTTNSRAVIRRACLDSASEDIDLDSLDQLFFITRNPLMPPVARLDDRQAAVAFMLGESIQTSAGDPDAAGEAIRVVGTNPFIVGPEGEEGNRFYELVRDNDIETFLINTGHVGPDEADIGVEDSVSVLTSVARGEVDWRADDRFGFEVPEDIPGVAVEALYPPDHYEEFTAELADLRAERRAYLARFETLAEEVREAVY